MKVKLAFAQAAISIPEIGATETTLDDRKLKGAILKLDPVTQLLFVYVKGKLAFVPFTNLKSGVFDATDPEVQKVIDWMIDEKPEEPAKPVAKRGRPASNTVTQ